MAGRPEARAQLHRLDLAFSRDQATRSTSSTAARTGRATCSTGWKAARTCTSAATPAAWPRTCKRSPAGHHRHARRHSRRRRQRLPQRPAGSRAATPGTCTDMSAHIRRRHQDARAAACAARCSRLAGQRSHRRAGRRRPDRADQVPRQLPAGRPRHPRRAPPGQKLEPAYFVHDPHPHAGRRGHARAVAEARCHRHHLCRTRPAHHHAPGLPVPRRDQGRTQVDHAGHQRRS